MANINRIAALLNSILENESGYVTFESLGWFFAFAPVDATGQILVKGKREEWRSYKNVGVLKTGNPHNPAEWGITFPDWSDIFPGQPREECEAAFNAVLDGTEYPGECPSPRGKPPTKGRGGKPAARKGGRRKASTGGADNALAAELRAMREEMQRLREENEAAKANLRRVLNGEKLETAMTPSPNGPAPSGDGAITLRNKAAQLLRSAISHCEMGEDSAAIAALNGLARIRRGN